MSAQVENKICDQPELNVHFDLMEESLKSPYIDLFSGQVEGLVRGQPGDFVLTPEYGRRANEIYQFEPRKDDIWVRTFPKSGTTWMEELVRLVVNSNHPKEAEQFCGLTKSLYLEGDCLLSPGGKVAFPPSWGVTSISKESSPRIIKTHLPFYLLPPKLLDTSKVVYVARNPKDVIVSSYHHYRKLKLHNFVGTVDQFADYTMEGKVYYAPYFPHVLETWEKRHHPNLLFIFYEEMKRDLRGVVERIATHLGKTLTEDQMVRVLDNLSFNRLAQNEADNAELIRKIGVMNEEGSFFRKGKTGDWKNHFSPELNQRIDKWIQDNLTGSDLKFEMELEKQD